MATYNEILNTDIDAESPITTGLMTRMRDNPEAIAEGATGATKVSVKAQRMEIFTSSGTFNVPSGVTQVWVEVVGGGGGGCGVSWPATGDGVTENEGTDGGASTFDTITANGGIAGQGFNSATQTTSAIASHGTATGGDLNITGGGSNGGASVIGRGRGTGTAVSITSDGGNGGYAFKVHTVTPLAAIPVTVGAGGAGGTKLPTHGGTDGQDGSDGYVVVRY